MVTLNMLKRDWLHFYLAGLLLAVSGVILVLSGCCQITPEKNIAGDLIKVSSFKTPMMGDLSYKETSRTLDPKTGLVTEKTVECSTSTNADKVINAGANFIKTGINEAEKAGALLP